MVRYESIERNHTEESKSPASSILTWLWGLVVVLSICLVVLIINVISFIW